MKYLAVLALATLAVASPLEGVQFEKRQGVPNGIAPAAAPPAGCSGSFTGGAGNRFAIAIEAAGSQNQKRQAPTPTPAPGAKKGKGNGNKKMGKVTQIPDGQIQAGPATNVFPQAAPTGLAGGAGGAAPASGSTAAQANPNTNSSGTVCNAELTIQLNNGVLIDQNGRTGYIASNRQFQFDGPAQSGAIYTGGFSSCSDGTLALGGSKVFYSCESGDFSNLYDEDWAAQCSPVYIQILPDVCKQ